MDRFFGLVAFAGSLAAAGAAPGHTYPSQPLRVITSQTGGSLDFAARLLAPGPGASLGQRHTRRLGPAPMNSREPVPAPNAP